jgi:hypothetical protein
MPNELKSRSDTDASALREAAEQELAALRGGTNPENAGDVNKPEELSAPAQETEEASEEVEEESAEAEADVEPQDEDSEEEAEPEEKSKQPAKSEEQIRKEVEREMKRKYLKPINLLNQKVKELEGRSASIKSVKDPEDVKTLIQAELARRDYSGMENAEKKNLFSAVPDYKKHQGEISNFKDPHPTLSWTEAAKLWAIDNKPELLSKSKQKPSFHGNEPTPKNEDDDSRKSLREKAQEEFRKTSSFYAR